MNAKKIKILIVEDDEIVLAAAKNSLLALSCQVDVADCGRTAVKLFQENHYDLVFMDIAMLDPDGFTVTETFRKIEAEQSRKHTPVLAVSAYEDESFKERAQSVGIDAYLVKPITITQYQAILENFCSRK